MFKLVIQDDEGKTTVVPLIRDEITIGRKEGNTIRLTERNVSRRHARIVRNNGEVQIEDLGSYNGIRVNNARIAERVSLRVSDQVQIGDYKLYLKAEGVEQVDDARTMPIERVDSPIATEIMPAVAPSSPTTPIPAAVVAAAAAGPAAARPVSGTADTDPSGRPVASAAQVAALSATATYGKLVVISSNFAGKEFDLTRPQMIVGRTDENDIVVNHRSISRNHAKVTRDTETGRYTISDLQSSNGVRVNGQDYGKVELRRGDTVDLGHVRLRFVEPGEDFVFSRDAVIADVAEPGGKKGLLVAIVLGVLVLAGVGAFFVLNKKSDDSGKQGDHGGLVGSDKGTTGSDLGTGPGSNQVADNNNPENPGSNAGPGSSGVAPPPPTDETGKIKLECLGYQSDKKWQELTNCAGRLMAKDPESAKALAKKAKGEQANELQAGKVDDAIKDSNLVTARKLLDKIDDESVYKKQEAGKVADLEKAITDQFRDRAQAAKNAGKCADVDVIIGQARKQSPSIADAISSYKCDKVAANPDHGGGANPVHPPNGGGSAVVTAPPANCDADALEEEARQQEAIGQHGAALAKMEKAITCKPTEHRFQLAFMSACNAGNKAKAKYYYKKSGANRGSIAQMCVRNGIPVPELEAP